LQEAGAHVVFGLPPMKVHSKLLLIQREGVQFAALSTGNFHEGTARSYVDSTLFTADPRLTAEVDETFEYIERASRMRVLASPRFSHLLVSPFNMRRVVARLLEEETAKGPDGYVCLKVNHLTDEKMIKKIRRAADAGVKMDLIVRTTYAMLPHPNIRAISIVDQFLEHQRVYVFGRGDAARVFVGSSDLMERNLDWRVEAVFPVYDAALRGQVLAMLQFQIEDDCKARYYDEKQSNPYVGGPAGDRRSQRLTREYFETLYRESIRSAEAAAEGSRVEKARQTA
jgi:polyphosphate kinase